MDGYVQAGQVNRHHELARWMYDGKDVPRIRTEMVVIATKLAISVDFTAKQASVY